jgi:hypothetical protein
VTLVQTYAGFSVLTVNSAWWSSTEPRMRTACCNRNVIHISARNVYVMFPRKYPRKLPGPVSSPSRPRSPPDAPPAVATESSKPLSNTPPSSSQTPSGSSHWFRPGQSWLSGNRCSAQYVPPQYRHW